MNRQYIGARYVPKVFEFNGSSNWMQGIEYEALTIVTYAGTSYTSKKPVPVGVGSPNLNPEYWVATGNYNAQVEGYRQDVATVQIELNEFKNELQGVPDQVETLTVDMGVLNSKLTIGNPALPVDPYKDVAAGLRETLNTNPNHYSLNCRDQITGNDYIEKTVLKDDSGKEVEVSTNVSAQIPTGNGTISAPYQTLDYFFSRANRGKVDLRCYINKEGYYIVNRAVLVGCAVHITATVDNVHILFSNRNINWSTANVPGDFTENKDALQDFSFYSSHVRIDTHKDLSASARIHIHLAPTTHAYNKKIYIEDGSGYWEHVYLHDNLTLYNSNLAMIASDSEAEIRSEASRVRLSAVHFHYQKLDRCPIYILWNSQLLLYGDIQWDILPGTGTGNSSLVWLENSRATIETALNYQPKYNHGISAKESIIHITKARLDAYNNNTVSGNDFSRGQNVVITVPTVATISQ